MFYIYKKLVTVAEAMVASHEEFVADVESVEVSVTGNQGHIRLGFVGIVGSSYCSEDNVVYPEYGIDYKVYHYAFVEGEWSVLPREEVIVQSSSACVEEAWVDDLPF